VQSVLITTNVVSLNPAYVLDTTLCDKVCQLLATCQLFSPGTLVSSTNKADRHDITEILLKVVFKHLNTSFPNWENNIPDNTCSVL
jgi:hypothetical protein